MIGYRLEWADFLNELRKALKEQRPRENTRPTPEFEMAVKAFNLTVRK